MMRLVKWLILGLNIDEPMKSGSREVALFAFLALAVLPFFLLMAIEYLSMMSCLGETTGQYVVCSREVMPQAWGALMVLGPTTATMVSAAFITQKAVQNRILKTREATPEEVADAVSSDDRFG